MGSGGKRVTISVARPSRRSAATISRMKSDRSGVEGVSLVTVAALLTVAWQERRLAAAHHTPGGSWLAR